MIIQKTSKHDAEVQNVIGDTVAQSQAKHWRKPTEKFYAK